MLSSCSGDRCIDADDFGFAKFDVSSRYSLADLNSQQQDNEMAPWLPTSYLVNGRPLAIVIKTWQYGVENNNAGEVSAWCPWYGGNNNSATLSRFCERLRECTFIDDQMCTPTKDAQINNAPCLLKNGVGLYGLIATPGTDPNASVMSERNPDGITFHLGEKISGYNLYDLGQDGTLRNAGGIIYSYDNSSALKEKYLNSHLYFKILDKYYEDNNGQYKVIIKSGISDNHPDPVQFVTNLVKNYLFGTSYISGGSLQFNMGGGDMYISPQGDIGSSNQGAKSAADYNSLITKVSSTDLNSQNNNYGLIRALYTNITQNSGYQNAVNGLLSLYIIFTTLSFLAGNLNITHTELIARVIKIGIISALLSSKYSWSFFNDYLFVFFVGGVEQILHIIQAAGATGPGSASILGLLIAPQTIAKLLSLLLVDWRGIFYLILFIIALYIVLTMLFKAAIIYLTALIAIGMIITMAPIFICFMLFKVTRSLFENWLKQLISYAIQPIILFTGIIFISVIIRTEIYSTLGFRVCKHSFPNLGPISELFGDNVQDLDTSLTNSFFYWWFPSPMRGEDFSRKQAVIPVPNDHFDANDKFCEAYGCFENRYVELPFLDPQKDKRRIENFFAGNFLQFDGLLIIFIAIYVLRKFNDTAVSISSFIVSTSGNLTSISSVANQAYAPVQKQIDRPGNYIKGRVNKAREDVKEKFSGAVNSFMLKRVGNQALSSSANASVLAEVKRNYGLDQSIVKANAVEKYRGALTNLIKENNPKISDKDLKEKVDKLASKNYQSLKDELAALKYGEGKKYANLSENDKKQVDGSLKKKFGEESVRTLLVDARNAQDFRDAYIQSHQAMSARGIGIIGKNVKSFRSLQEIKNERSEQKAREEANRYGFGENVYSNLEGFKSAVTGGIGGRAWHGIDYSDYRARTYSETLRDRQNNNKFSDLQKQISNESTLKGSDVLAPEYLANLSASNREQELNYYKNLSNQELKYEIYNSLSAGTNPASLGEKFLREEATNEQLKNLIDRTDEVKQQILLNDRYVRQEDAYEVRKDEAVDTIKDIRAKYEADNLSIEEMQNKFTSLGKSGESDAAKLQKALQDFEKSQQILQQIDERKMAIEAEVQNHVDDLNKIRVSKSQSIYEVEKPSQARRLRKIEDYLR